MLNAKLCFSIKLGWQQTIFENLKNLAVNYKWEEGESTWVFRVDDVKKVEALLGKPISIEDYRDKFTTEKVKQDDWKGFSGYKVIEYPTIYQIIEHRKIEKEQGEWEVKEIKHEIPKELVSNIWKFVISIQPLNKPIKTKTIAEHICKFFYLERFFRDTNTLDFNKFFGSRKDYFTFFYYPMKVLAYQGKIIHHKKGKIERVSN